MVFEGGFTQYEKADIRYKPHFYSHAEAKRLFLLLRREINWQQDKIKVYGKTYCQPRLTAFYGDNHATYAYSGLRMTPKPFSKTLQMIRTDLARKAQLEFTSCLANLYRDGQDSNGWHADDEKELGENPVIASLSFGATRRFKFRRKDNHQTKFDIELSSGSLLIMAGETQRFWQHQIPKTQKKVGERINLTFREIKEGE